MFPFVLFKDEGFAILWLRW